MDPIQKLMLKAMVSVERSSAQAEVLEGVIADFFRLHLAADKASSEELKTGLAAVSDKLLANHAQALQAKEVSLRALHDLKAGLAEQAQKVKPTAVDAPEPGN